MKNKKNELERYIRLILNVIINLNDLLLFIFNERNIFKYIKLN